MPATTTTAPLDTPTGVAAPDLHLPTPPDDQAHAVPGEFRTVVPCRTELTALPQALLDLAAFVDFDHVLGATAPPHAETRAALASAAAWSSLRQLLAKWDQHAAVQEGLAWTTVRAHLGSVRPAFALALRRNPHLAEAYPGYATLLACRSENARRGAATKRANRDAQAAGEPPFHGKVGKRRERAAAKAALAAKRSGAAAASTGGVDAAVGEE